ncbi:MAG: hypothetical protein AAFY53_08855 [Pseudomonadota bacterium]
MTPRDAATILIYEVRNGTPHIFMGQRQASTVFMPNRFVFPGGRVDPLDATAADVGQPPSGHTVSLLCADLNGHRPIDQAKAIAMAAVRETFEEAGLVFGQPSKTSPDKLIDAARKAGAVGESWRAFTALGVTPDATPLTYFARAITPPGETRRYDTRFFCAERRHVAFATGENDGELGDLNWYAPDAISNLNVAPITSRVLRDFLDLHCAADQSKLPVSVPLYHKQDGAFRRDVLSV